MTTDNPSSQPPPSHSGHTLPGHWRGAATWGLVVAMGALLIGGIVVGVSAMKSDDDRSSGGDVNTTDSWYEVTRRNFDLSVIATGELDAARKTEIKCEVDGQTTIVDIVPEGAAVKKGDVLVTLTADSISDKLEQETLSLASAKAELIAAESGLAIAENKAEADQKGAEVKLRLAELDAAKWESGTDPQARRERALALEKAKRTAEKAARDLELSTQLEAEQFISWGELKDDEISDIEAKASLETAKLEQTVYEQYTRPKEQQQAKSDVEQAKSDLDRVKAENSRNLDRARADLQGRVDAMKIREERFARLKEQSDKTTIRAPEDGLVVYATSVGPNSRRNTPMAQGRQVRLGESLIILPDMKQMVSVIRVNESLIGQLKVDQTASVTIDALGGRVVQGKVYQIGVMAEDGGWFNPDLREYAVRIELPNNVGTLKPGMRCSAEVNIGRVENAVAIPVQAVTTEGEQRFCYVEAPGGIEKREVKLGKANESFAEVLKGLSEGERVLLRRPRPGELKDIE